MDAPLRDGEFAEDGEGAIDHAAIDRHLRQSRPDVAPGDVGMGMRVTVVVVVTVRSRIGAVVMMVVMVMRMIMIVIVVVVKREGLPSPRCLVPERDLESPSVEDAVAMAMARQLHPVEQRAERQHPAEFTLQFGAKMQHRRDEHVAGHAPQEIEVEALHALACFAFCGIIG